MDHTKKHSCYPSLKDMVVENRIFKRIARPKELSEDLAGFELESPSSIERSFFADVPDAPLKKACSFLQQYGVPPEKIQLYQQATKAFFEYPTLLTSSLPDIDFAPQESYFGPQINFMREQTLPDIAQSLNIKPHLAKKGSGFTPTKIDGEQVLEVLQQLPARKSGEYSAQEKMLSHINRLMYALHEPIHTTQGLSPGDRLNILMDELGTADAVDDVQAFKTSMEPFGLKTGDTVSTLSVIQHGVFGMPVEPLSTEAMKPGAPELQKVLAQMESTLDYIAEQSIGPFIKKQPAFVLWMHNTLSSLVEAIRALRSKLENGEQVSADDEGLCKKLAHLTGMIAPCYFSVFESSEDISEYLKSHKKTKILNRELSGPVVQAEAFDRLEIENLILECQKHLLSPEIQQQRFVTWTFPLSDKSYLVPLEGDDMMPITLEGTKIAAEVYAAMADVEFEPRQVQGFFDRLQQALEQESFSGDASRLDEIQAEADMVFNLELSHDELREMYGISHFTLVQLEERYVRGHVLQGEIIQVLSEEHPNEVKPLIQAIFTSVEMSSPGSRLYALGGFKPDKADEIDWDASWEKIESNTKLGVFGIDMTKLGQEEKETAKKEWEKYKAAHIQNEKGIEVTQAKRFLQLMAEWKRRQKAERALRMNPFAA